MISSSTKLFWGNFDEPYCRNGERDWISLVTLNTFKRQIELFGRQMEAIYKDTTVPHALPFVHSGLIIFECSGRKYICVVRTPKDTLGTQGSLNQIVRFSLLSDEVLQPLDIDSYPINTPELLEIAFAISPNCDPFETLNLYHQYKDKLIPCGMVGYEEIHQYEVCFSLAQLENLCIYYKNTPELLTELKRIYQDLWSKSQKLDLDAILVSNFLHFAANIKDFEFFLQIIVSIIDDYPKSQPHLDLDFLFLDRDLQYYLVSALDGIKDKTIASDIASKFNNHTKAFKIYI